MEEREQASRTGDSIPMEWEGDGFFLPVILTVVVEDGDSVEEDLEGDAGWVEGDYEPSTNLSCQGNIDGFHRRSARISNVPEVMGSVGVY